MKFELDHAAGGQTITAYAAGWIRLGDLRIDAPCVVTPAGVHEGLIPPLLADIDTSHFAAVVELSAEIIILGTGERQQFIDHGVVANLAALGVGLEIMDTGAACRSFNVLASEGRAVAAALYMI